MLAYIFQRLYKKFAACLLILIINRMLLLVLCSYAVILYSLTCHSEDPNVKVMRADKKRVFFTPSRSIPSIESSGLFSDIKFDHTGKTLLPPYSWFKDFFLPREKDITYWKKKKSRHKMLPLNKSNDAFFYGFAEASIPSFQEFSSQVNSRNTVFPILKKDSNLFKKLNSLISNVKVTSGLATSVKNGKVIVAYQGYNPHHLGDILQARIKFVKDLKKSLGLFNIFQSHYLPNIGMEIFEVPSKFAILEFIAHILRYNVHIQDVYVDQEIDNFGEGKQLVEGKSAFQENFSDAFNVNQSQSTFKQYNAIQEESASHMYGYTSKLKNLFDFSQLFFSNYKKLIDSYETPKNERLLQSTEVIPNDVYFTRQWPHLSSEISRYGIKTQKAWSLCTGPAKREITIALIDSGVDYTHPDLSASIWHNPKEICDNGEDDDNNGFIDDCVGWDFVNEDNDPKDDNGHGTASAGIIAAQANNALGITGICWGCKLMILKTLNNEIKGTVSGFVRAIDYAIGERAKISNNSYGGRGKKYGALYEAVNRADQAKMLFVAAAGNYQKDNDNDVNPVYPASYDLPNVISVSATTKGGFLSSFSSFGADTVDIAAPGEEIFTTFLGGGYEYVQGTSFAAPFVSGAAALLWAYEPKLSHTQVLERLTVYQMPLRQLQGLTKRGGILDVWAALTEISSKRLKNSNELKPHVEICSSTKVCHRFADCSHSKNGVQCVCKNGFIGDGKSCEDINECKENPCGIASNCYNSVGAFECRCKNGFKRKNGVCEDINECHYANSCPPNAKCINLPGDYDCICPKGSHWNSLTGSDASCTVKTEMNSICLDYIKCGINSFCMLLFQLWQNIVVCSCHEGYVPYGESQDCVRPGILKHAIPLYLNKLKVKKLKHAAKLKIYMFRS